MKALRERFEEKVLKTEGCWEWQGAQHRQGYGTFYVGNRRTDKAHRVAWALYVGPIPTGKFVLHHCDNPRCVRIAHLYIGDQRLNVQDAVARGRHKVGKPFLPGQFKGERNGRAKLTAAKAQEIRSRLAAGEGRRAIAQDHGISLSLVTWIKKGEVWRGDCLHGDEP